MRSSSILTLSSFLSTSFASVASVARDSNATATTSPAAACQFFKSNYTNLTFLPEDTGYTAENQGNWNAGAWLSPACIFAPANANDLSTAVTKLTELNTLFAMRGGGHMPMATAANINSSGVLISSTNMDFLQLSDDKQNMSMGPGNRWFDVYSFLNETDPEIAVVGGRLAPVGVPGLLLGGGFSFYSYEYGMSSTNGNILGYQCVLANGTIIEITSSNQYSDLFWALKGGGNSFCLVTRFDMKTISSPITMMAEATYGNSTEVKDNWIDSVLNFAHNASVDPRGAITPVARYGPLVGRSYDSTLFYNGNDSTPAVLNDFLGGLITPTNSSSIFGNANSNTALVQMSVADYGALSKQAFEPGGASYGLRQRFHVYPVKATKEAMNIVHDTYFETAEAMLANVTGVFTGLAWNPITESFINATNSGIGSPLNPTEAASFWTEESLTWENAEDDAVIENFLQTVNANITTQLTAINATASFLYLNDADQDQNVFATYPAANLQRLKDIRDKYDPNMIYTNLMPGGFKVASD